MLYTLLDFIISMKMQFKKKNWEECFLEHCLVISDFILHIYLLILFSIVCVCVLHSYQLDFVNCFGFLHEFLIEMYIYIQWFCELRSQAFEIRKK